MELLYSKFQIFGSPQLLPSLLQLTETLGNANHFKLLQLEIPITILFTPLQSES